MLFRFEGADSGVEEIGESNPTNRKKQIIMWGFGCKPFGQKMFSEIKT